MISVKENKMEIFKILFLSLMVFLTNTGFASEIGAPLWNFTKEAVGGPIAQVACVCCLGAVLYFLGKAQWLQAFVSGLIAVAIPFIVNGTEWIFAWSSSNG